MHIHTRLRHLLPHNCEECYCLLEIVLIGKCCSLIIYLTNFKDESALGPLCIQGTVHCLFHPKNCTSLFYFIPNRIGKTSQLNRHG